MIEKNTQFSHSILWSLQKSFFQNRGYRAWNDGRVVPYYVTNNNHFAYNAAQTVIQTLLCMLQNRQIDEQNPIYLMELGTGSGKFSFLFLNNLIKLIEIYRIDKKIRIKYIMSDFTQKNIDYWKSQPQLRKYIEDNIIEFAIFDADLLDDDNIVLQNSEYKLTNKDIVNPLILIGNYFFDGIRVDHIRYQSKNQPLALAMSTIYKKDNQLNIDNMQEIDNLDNRLSVNFSFENIVNNHYNIEGVSPESVSIANVILTEYANDDSLENKYFSIPTQAIKVIDYFIKFTNNKFMLLSHDNGVTSSTEFYQNEPSISFHGSFSIAVNFDFIAKYIMHKSGGSYLLSEPVSSLKAILAMSGGCNENLSANNSIQTVFNNGHNYVDGNSFLDLKNALLNINDNKVKNSSNGQSSSQNDKDMHLNIRQIICLLKFSRCDPDIFYSIADHLAKEISLNNHIQYIDWLVICLGKIADNFYFIGYKDIPFELARIYHLLSQYKFAVEYYNLSKKYFSTDQISDHNINLCMMEINKNK